MPPAVASPIVLRASDRAPQPWRNGGGVTFEIARRAAPPMSRREFLWRVSIADVSRPGPFSSFAGFERLIAVIEGAGMRLEGLPAGGVELRPFEPYRFDGAARVNGVLPRGPVSDLNVIYDPQRCAASLSLIEDELPQRRCESVDLLIVNLGTASMECLVDNATVRLDRRDVVWISSPASTLAGRGIERAAIIEIGPGRCRS